MPNRRKALTFSELDNYPQAKGKGAILRSPEEVAAEQDQQHIEELVLPTTQETDAQESTQTRKQENKETSFSEKNQEPKPSPSPAPISEYKKATYKMSEEALDALDESKRLLKRKHGLKASLESIVEAAIMDAYHDLEENKETSFLVNWFAGKQENK